MRYRHLGQGQPKILWILSSEGGQSMAGTNLPSVGSVMWLDQGRPWAYFHVEELNYNVEVRAFIRQRDH